MDNFLTQSNALKFFNRNPAIPWTIETSGFFRKKRLKIFTEEVTVTHGAALPITLNAANGHYGAFPAVIGAVFTPRILNNLVKI